MARCEDCGAETTAVTCAELFDVLLALDHSRRRPWGPLHAVVTAAYFLQHPSDPRAALGLQGVGVMLIDAYLRGGETALTAATEQVRRDHRAGAPSTTTRPAGGAAPRGGHGAAATVSIHDLAAGGTFPAAGYRSRARRWLAAAAHDGDYRSAATGSP